MAAPAALVDAMALVLKRARATVRKCSGLPAVEDLRDAIAKLDAVAVDQAIEGWSESQRPLPPRTLVRDPADEILAPEQQREMARLAGAFVEAATTDTPAQQHVRRLWAYRSGQGE